MAGGGVTPDTCLALGRRCWAFDMEERAETRPEIESHTWSYSPDQALSWPVSSKGKADLVIFDPPYFDKKADGYGEKSISGLQRKEYLEFLEAVKNDHELCRIPVVVLTTSTNSCDIDGTFSHSVAGYMVKPIDYDKLVNIIKTINDYWAINVLPMR